MSSSRCHISSPVSLTSSVGSVVMVLTGWRQRKQMCTGVNQARRRERGGRWRTFSVLTPNGATGAHTGHDIFRKIYGGGDAYLGQCWWGESAVAVGNGRQLVSWLSRWHEMGWEGRLDGIAATLGFSPVNRKGSYISNFRCVLAISRSREDPQLHENAQWLLTIWSISHSTSRLAQ